MALVIGVVFMIGITVGIIAVIALSAVRRDRRTDPRGPCEAADPARRWPDEPGDGFGDGH